MQDSASNQIDKRPVQVPAQKAKREHFLLGIIGGIAAVAVGAIVWASITYLTKFQIGWMAIGVGFLVGFTMRLLGKGESIKFGIIGALLALLGCLFGNILTTCIWASKEFNVSFLRILSNLDFQLIINILKDTFSPLDLLFYAIAIYSGYRFSFKKENREEPFPASDGQ